MTDNKIGKLDGLEACKSLSYLSIAHNRIEKIENLQGLPIKYLNLVSVLILIFTNTTLCVSTVYSVLSSESCEKKFIGI